MSNLGLYQKMTTAAKQVGGPANFLILVGVVGYGVLRLGEAGVREIVNRVSKHIEEKKNVYADQYTVHTRMESNEGLVFNIGDTYRVLEVDGDAILIEMCGEDDNPHFISAELLKSISNWND